MAAGWGIDSRDSIPAKGNRFVYTPQRPDQPWGPPSLLFNGYEGALSQREMRPCHETDHSAPSIADVKKSGATPPLPIHLHDAVFNLLKPNDYYIPPDLTY
jgi:hypothetical protein